MSNEDSDVSSKGRLEGLIGKLLVLYFSHLVVIYIIIVARACYETKCPRTTKERKGLLPGEGNRDANDVQNFCQALR
jgi:hypothetical protein